MRKSYKTKIYSFSNIFTKLWCLVYVKINVRGADVNE